MLRSQVLLGRQGQPWVPLQDLQWHMFDVKAVVFRKPKRRRMGRGGLLWTTRQQLMRAATPESLGPVSLHTPHNPASQLTPGQVHAAHTLQAHSRPPVSRPGADKEGSADGDTVMAARGDDAHQGQAEHQNDSDAADLAQAAGAPSQDGNSPAPQSGEPPAEPRDAAAGGSTEAAAEAASRQPAKAEAGAEPMSGTEIRTSSSVLAAPEDPLAAELHSAKSASSALQQEAAAAPSTQEGAGELHVHTEADGSEIELLAAKQLKQEPAEGAGPPDGALQGATSENNICHTADTQRQLPAASVEFETVAAVAQEVSVKKHAETPTSARGIGGDMAAEASDAAAGPGSTAAEAGNMAADACDQPADCTAEVKQASSDQPSTGDEDGTVLTQDETTAAAAEQGGPAEKEAAVEGTAEDDDVRVIPICLPLPAWLTD